MNHETYKNYLRDLSYLLIEAALESRDSTKIKTGEDRIYELGRSMAYYEVISLMQQQCDAFGINLKAISMDRIDPDKDLLC